MENILAVITDWDDAPRVMASAVRLARQFNTSLEVLRPVHNPLAELDKYVGFGEVSTLRNSIMEEERKRVDALCADCALVRPVNGQVEWCERVHQAIVDRAESYGAGLIVMMASHHSLLSTLVHTPDDWHLFRDAPCPVLSMVREPKPVTEVVAAIDALDASENHRQLSARVVDYARALAKAEGVPLCVLSAVPDPALMYAGLVNAPMSGNFLEQTVDKARENLHLLLTHLGVDADRIEVKAGRVEDVVTLEGEAGGLLVIGSAANKGLKGFLIGNTAERILQHMRSDMLVVN